MDSKVPVKNAPDSPTREPIQSGYVSNESIAKMIADAVAEALKVAIPAAAIGINAAQSQANDKNKAVMVREIQRRTKRCPICALPETACGGPWKKDKEGNAIEEKHADGSNKYAVSENHELAYVGPKDDNLFKWFQGIICNGVRFLSDRPNHQIWIPKKSDILTYVNAWEHNEKELSQRRQAEGNGAGYVGPQGQVINRGNPNAIGWR